MPRHTSGYDPHLGIPASNKDCCVDRGCKHTISLAVSASCVENAQHMELATWLAGQIARAAAIFNVDEVVIIDESNAAEGHVGKGAALLARVLQYMETPQYLRR
jgi:hypothetical protein